MTTATDTRLGRTLLLGVCGIAVVAAIVKVLILGPTPGIRGPAGEKAPWTGSAIPRAVDHARTGDLEFQNRRLSVAEQAYRMAIQQDPKLASAHLALAWIHTLQARRSEAVADYSTVADLRPLDFDQVLVWTQVRCGIWDPEKATGPLRECLEQDPLDRGVRLSLAEGLRRLGAVEEVKELLTPFGDADPEALAIRARSALDRQDLQTADALLGRGPDNHPELAELRGQIALLRRQAPVAEGWFRMALDSEPSRRQSMLGLAQALRITGKSDTLSSLVARLQRHDHILDLTRRASEAPRQSRVDGVLLRDLGSACEALGYQSESRAWYRLAIGRDPLDSEAQAGLFRLGGSRENAIPGAHSRP